MKLRAAFAVLAAIFAMSLSSGAFALSSKEVERELMCQCGCTMVVDVCDCETANQIRTKIAEMIGQGQNKDQMLGYFVTKYGEKMLASPPKKGFNLIAWVVPFAAVAAGAVALFFLLRAWARKGKSSVEEAVVLAEPVSAEESEAYRGRLEAELKRYNEEGSI